MKPKEFENILEDLRRGKMVLLQDDEERENEGDLVVAAEKVTAEHINFMASEGRGLICVPITRERASALNLERMTRQNTTDLGTAFTVSVDAREGVSTGISASDRARTAKVLIDEETEPEDLDRPGHMFPLIARDEGVFKRQGQTEGSVDLMKLAGLKPGAVICEVMNPDGTMARDEDLKQFCEEHDIKRCSIRDVIQYRVRKENIIEEAAQTELPTMKGNFDLRLFRSRLDDHTHLAFLPDSRDGEMENPIVRIHSQCLTGEVFGSKRCDCRRQLIRSMEIIQEYGNGVLLYSSQEGRGIGLENKIKAYELKDDGLDTVQANRELGFKKDQRQFWSAAKILEAMGMDQVRLLTNNPKKVEDLESVGVSVEDRVPLEVQTDEEAEQYMETKKEKLDHILQETKS